MQITPACNIPLRCLKGGGKLVIVNLQKTPKDKKASMVIHAKADDVMFHAMLHMVREPNDHVLQEKEDCRVTKTY